MTPRTIAPASPAIGAARLTSRTASVPLLRHGIPHHDRDDLDEHGHHPALIVVVHSHRLLTGTATSRARFVFGVAPE